MSKPLVIASSLIALQNAELAGHKSRPEVIALGEMPWLVPPHADALFTYQIQWRQAPAEAPEGWPFNLRWVQIASAGTDTFPRWLFDVPLVTRGRGVQAPAIGEFVIGAIYAHEKRFWDGPVRSPEAWKHKMLGGVAGKTVGIAGMGAIGEEVARTARAIGMQVKALTRSSSIAMEGVEAVASLPELFAQVDHLVLALPLTPETRGSVDAACLAQARPGLHLINVARGALIDDVALVAALDAGKLSAATLDVTAPEPLPDGHPLYTHPLVRLTPHVSGMAENTEQRLAERLAHNLDCYMAGEPVPGVVERGRGY